MPTRSLGRDKRTDLRRVWISLGARGSREGAKPPSSERKTGSTLGSEARLRGTPLPRGASAAWRALLDGFERVPNASGRRGGTRRRGGGSGAHGPAPQRRPRHQRQVARSTEVGARAGGARRGRGWGGWRWGGDFVFLGKGWGGRARGHGRRWLPGARGVGGVTLLFLPFDAEILEASRIADDKAWTHRAARGISYWGDFYTGTALLCALIWLVGLVWKRRQWRLVGISALAAASVAGLSADLLQISFGRPRPSTGVEDGLYGFKLESGYHGFPSGHAATAVGTSSGIAFSCPWVAIPVYAAGLSVGWSRVELNRHHWSDIVVGAGLGVGAGYLLGYRRRRRRIP